ncbi:MAG: hypothetical protein ACE37F_00230 [Nannocystaceae bacterium]|nr:DUF6263 family protein [bacterium]
MPARLRSVVLPWLLCVACTSSAGEDAQPAPSAPAESKDAAKDAKAKAESGPAENTKRLDIASAEPPTITLLEAGTDPQRLRLSPTAGAAEAMTMTMTMSMQMGPDTPRVAMPPIVTTMRSEVDTVSEGSIRATVNFESMTVEATPSTPKALVENLEATLSGFESFESSIVLDERGALLGGTIDAPQGLPAPLQQTMNQMQESFGKLQVPLPEEPVGVGGRWKAVSNIEQGGMKIEQTATYEITAREGDAVKLKVGLTQKVVEPTFSPPGMPGVTGTIERYDGSGQGTLELQLDQLTPTRSAMTISVDMQMTVDMLGQSQTQALTMDVDVALERTE